MDLRRAQRVKDGALGSGPVLYWMSRDQRVRDNWALLYARKLAAESGGGLAVAFCLADVFPGAQPRHYEFMLSGLREVERELQAVRVPFYVLRGDPGVRVPELAARLRARAVVTDFDPLRIKRGWKAAAARNLLCPMHEVDAHNIVPCWLASPKQEFAARTLRPKLKRALPEFLVEFPRLEPLARQAKPAPPVDWDRLRRDVGLPGAVGPSSTLPEPGSAAAGRALDAFLRRGLRRYHAEANDPNAEACSRLSPYLHFGQISAQRAALEAMRAPAPRAAREAFLEQLIVRRELSDNYCFYNPDYDRYRGIPAWADRTLEAHRGDRRPERYAREPMERGETGDPLWNAAQRQMVTTGWMHGYLRMYWAKRVLEWTESAEEAFEIVLAFNDRYEFDGRDPNGYVGVAWSIGGLHDRPWRERPIYGMIRYMNAAGCRRKFSVEEYIQRWGEPRE